MTTEGRSPGSFWPPAEQSRSSTQPSTHPTRGGRYRFGAFELNSRTFELRHGGESVAVQPKVLKLLVYLVENRDRVVPSTEIRAALWPDTTVSPASLKRAVCAARHVLGENASSQSSIRTLRGQGYRFVVAVQEVSAPSAPAPPVPGLWQQWMVDEATRRATSQLSSRRDEYMIPSPAAARHA